MNISGNQSYGFVSKRRGAFTAWELAGNLARGSVEDVHQVCWDHGMNPHGRFYRQGDIDSKRVPKPRQPCRQRLRPDRTLTGMFWGTQISQRCSYADGIASLCLQYVEYKCAKRVKQGCAIYPPHLPIARCPNAMQAPVPPYQAWHQQSRELRSRKKLRREEEMWGDWKPKEPVEPKGSPPRSSGGGVPELKNPPRLPA